ncbi:unnamed protein product [Periconia digitata]|uniref:Alkyl hydroperoxide reductase subunit C/ Thiol specific antioxidant domain-containing protein n=1 Tax=Periconia digitata TaxID=1303443 RepID=A0A9W4XKU3_9PLEO|nr:unnamed protein product [Periconia digitata]
MTTPPAPPPEQTAARTPLSFNELADARKIEVYGIDGKSLTLGELINGKRSVLIFTRHFWCVNCQAYVRAISESIPPSKLPQNTQIIFISNGSYQPIKSYATITSSAYPIYTDPTCRLHSILKFNSALKEASSTDEKRDYMRNAGSTMGRVFGGIKVALGQLEHTAYIGPKSLNGGEVIISADGECEFIYRMQNTTDHINVSELVKLVGVEGGQM